MIKKKSLGQHFLHEKKVVEDIVSSSSIPFGETVLEIGPGEGVLTEKLLLTGAKVIAVEKDHRLIPELHKRFSKEISQKQLQVVHADVLDESIPNIIEGQYSIVANIPYYITGQILRNFLETSKQPKNMTLLIQKEVAERIVAKDGKESLLSLSVKVFGDPEIVRFVGKGAFNPPPDVDSAVLAIKNISKNRLVGISQELFFKTLKAGFSHKRKQLLGNLSSEFRKDLAEKALKDSGILPSVRAEDIPLSGWIALCKQLPR